MNEWEIYDFNYRILFIDDYDNLLWLVCIHCYVTAVCVVCINEVIKLIIIFTDKNLCKIKFITDQIKIPISLYLLTF